MSRKEETKSRLLFNLIAPVYGLFFGFQRRTYEEILRKVQDDIDLASYRRVLDVGCGTGALCSVFNERGFFVTGVDPAGGMLVVAKKKKENEGVHFLQADALEGLPFEEDAFDLVIASYVLHGLMPKERRKLYLEMSRVCARTVIIHDYSGKRSLLTSFIEWLEGGDYFHFIKHAEAEIKDCSDAMQRCFSEVRILDVGARAYWYVCTPNRHDLSVGKQRDGIPVK